MNLPLSDVKCDIKGTDVGPAFETWLDTVKYHVEVEFAPSDGLYYAWADESPFWGDGKTVEQAASNLAKEILDFAKECVEDCKQGVVWVDLYKYFPQFIKALYLNDPNEIERSFVWQAGEICVDSANVTGGTVTGVQTTIFTKSA
jgi:hypothetical protein